MKIEIQEHWYSIEECDKNPNKLYVFGDNCIRKGTAGQAVIRHCGNSIGIATKRLPSTTDDSYFSDTNVDDVDTVIDDILLLMKTSRNGLFDTIVFPKDGLGTGLAKMDKKAPKLFNTMNELISSHFKIKYII